jgi:hypothetical protein
VVHTATAVLCRVILIRKRYFISQEIKNKLHVNLISGDFVVHVCNFDKTSIITVPHLQRVCNYHSRTTELRSQISADYETVALKLNKNSQTGRKTEGESTRQEQALQKPPKIKKD